MFVAFGGVKSITSNTRTLISSNRPGLFDNTRSAESKPSESADIVFVSQSKIPTKKIFSGFSKLSYTEKRIE